MRHDGSKQSRSIIAALGTLLVLVVAGQRCAGEEKELNPQVKASASISKPSSDGKQRVTLTIHINKDWYIYANLIKNDTYKNNQTIVRVGTQGKLENFKINYPAGKPHGFLGDKYMIYDEKVTIDVIVQRTAGNANPLEVDLLVNTCHVKGYCLPKAEVRFTLP